MFIPESYQTLIAASFLPRARERERERERGLSGRQQRMMGEVGEKRKHPVEKKIVMLINSELGDRCAALFEFKIQITKTTISGDVCDLETEAEADNALKPIAFFYHHRQHPEINSVAACCVFNNNSSSKNVVYVMPDDLELGIVYNPDNFFTDEYLELISKPRDILPLCTFDLKTYKKQTLPPNLLPQTRKLGPILAAVNDNKNNTTRVFALSAYTHPHFKVLDPCFESFDLKNNKWSPLPCPPFHIGKLPPRGVEPFYVVGHALLFNDNNNNNNNNEEENDGYILVSFTQQGVLKTTRFYTYNIRSQAWKPALLRHPDVVVAHEDDAPRILGEAVSIGNNIYAYNNGKLYVFTYTNLYNQSGGGGGGGVYDLALGSATLVEGVKFNEKIMETDWDAPYTYSGAIAKIDDDILCVLHTLYPTCLEVQCVCVTFIQLKKRELCDTLKSFICTVPTGESLYDPTIKSCFVLDPDETSDRGKRAAM